VDANLKLQKRLEQTEQALQRCERLTVASRYAGAVMHEVNNPLAAITNLVYLTALQADDPDRVRENLRVIDTQLKTLSKVTSQVLTFHREQPCAKDFDLIEIMESALKLHANRLENSNIALTRDFRRPAIASVFASEILQVVSNLLLNAFDAMPSKSAQLQLRIYTRKDAVHITVSDNGIGIPPEVRKRLFTPHLTTKATGTGLGLWLSMGIVQKHGGSLRVRTSHLPGKSGTTFRLSLPIGKAS
jgi:C4-dicarboxylate-specific signal transduction histidine kinase